MPLTFVLPRAAAPQHAPPVELQLTQFHTSTGGVPRTDAAHDGRLQLSYSQLETRWLCPRKWFLQQVAAIRPRRKAYFQHGQALHDIAERITRREAVTYPVGWDADLTPDEALQLREQTQAAIEKGILTASPVALVEHPFALLVTGHGPVLARADLRDDPDRGRIIAPPAALADGRPLLGDLAQAPYLVGFIDHYERPRDGARAFIADHKSSKNRHYGKSKRDVAGGHQLPLYAVVPLLEFPGEDAIEAAYNVFLKDPEAPRPVYQVRDTISRIRAAEVWSEIDAAAREMGQIRQAFPRRGARPQLPKGLAAGVAGDPTRGNAFRQVPGVVDTCRGDRKAIDEACGAFGGCPFRDACFGYRDMEALVRDIDLDFLRGPETPAERLAQMAARAAAAAAPTINPFTLQVGATPILSRVSLHLPTSGASMPFGTITPSTPPAPVPGTDIYLIDPQDPQTQYRARVISVAHDAVIAALWPATDTEPDWATLDAQYHTPPVPVASIARQPWPGVKLIGYAEAYIAAGAKPPPWKPQQPLQQAPTQTHAAGDLQALAHTMVGQVVEVTLRDVDSKYTRELQQVLDEGLMLDGILVAVPWERIDGLKAIGVLPKALPLTKTGDVVAAATVTKQEGTWSQSTLEQAAGRSEREGAQAWTLTPGTSFGDAPAQSTQTTVGDACRERWGPVATKLVGKWVHIRLTGVPVPHRLLLVSCDATGLQFETKAAKWEEIADLQAADDVPIPGDPKDAKRVEKKKDIESLTAETAIERIHAIVTKGMEKKQPSIGKKDLEQVQELLVTALARLATGPQPAPTTTPSTAAADHYVMVFNDAIEKAVELLRGAQEPAF